MELKNHLLLMFLLMFVFIVSASKSFAQESVILNDGLQLQEDDEIEDPVEEDPAVTIEPPVAEAEILISSAGPFGNAFLPDNPTQLFYISLDVVFTELYPTLNTYNTDSVARDIRVRFTEKAGESAAQGNSTIFRINGAVYTVTDYLNGVDERGQDFIISRDWLRQGSNTFEFFSQVGGANQIWGIKDILIEYLPTITLNIDEINDNTYGSDTSPIYPSGVRAFFDAGDEVNTLQLSVKGWDIDTTTEVEVFLNGRSIGFLSATDNNSFGEDQSFRLNKNELLTGENMLEFINTDSSDPWRVNDLLLEISESINLSPLFYLLD